jgi:hypothetical protein
LGLHFLANIHHTKDIALGGIAGYQQHPGRNDSPTLFPGGGGLPVNALIDGSDIMRCLLRERGTGGISTNRRDSDIFVTTFRNFSGPFVDARKAGRFYEFGFRLQTDL